jgi:dipeptidyl aminopeptidase/acylaminoacyl peptidase
MHRTGGSTGLAMAAAMMIAAVGMAGHAKELSELSDEENGTTVSAIANMKKVDGLAHLLVSGVPEVPADVRRRVMQYLNARGAGLLDVTPDGQQVLMTTRFGDTAQLHLLEMPMGARHQLTFHEEPTDNGAFMPGNPQIIFYLQDAGGDEFSQIYRFDRKTGRATLLTDGKSRHGGLMFSPDGRRMAFLSTARNGRDMDVYVAETTNPADARRVVEEPGTWFPAGFSPDGKRLLVGQYRSVTDSDLHLLDLESGERRQLTPKDPPASVAGAAFSADGKGIYLVTDRYSDFNQMYYLDLARPETPPRPLTRDIPWDIEDLAVARDGSAVAFTANIDGIGTPHILNPKTGRIRRLKVPEGIVGSLHFPQQNSSRLFFTLDSPRSPSDIYHIDLRSGKVVRWTRSEVGGLDTSAFVDPVIVRYPSTDGVTVPAIYYKPRTPAGAPTRRPVLVIFHGGPESQSRPGYSSLVQLLANDFGIAVLMPNVRGSSGYGKAFLAMDDGVKREASLADIGATLDWIARQPELDPSRVAVYGGSYGGYMSLAALAFYPGRVRAGVAVVAISSIPTFLQNTQEYRRDLRRAEYGDERDPAVRAVLERISPLYHADKIEAALYVQQGRNDPRVPQSEAEQIVEAVRSKGREVWYLLALNEGHGFARKENRDYALITAMMFLREQLLVGDPPEGP